MTILSLIAAALAATVALIIGRPLARGFMIGWRQGRERCRLRRKADMIIEAVARAEQREREAAERSGESDFR